MNSAPISEEIMRQVAEEPATVPHGEVARKYGLSWYHVKNIRMRAGVEVATDKKPAKPKKSAKKKAHRKPAPEETLVELPANPYAGAIKAVEEQIALYTQTLAVLQGLHDAHEQE